MKLSEAVLIAGIVSSSGAAVALMGSALLAEAAAGPITAAADAAVLAADGETGENHALPAALARALQSGAAAKMGE